MDRMARRLVLVTPQFEAQALPCTDFLVAV